MRSRKLIGCLWLRMLTSLAAMRNLSSDMAQMYQVLRLQPHSTVRVTNLSLIRQRSMQQNIGLATWVISLAMLSSLPDFWLEKATMVFNLLWYKLEMLKLGKSNPVLNVAISGQKLECKLRTMDGQPLIKSEYPDLTWWWSYVKFLKRANSLWLETLEYFTQSWWPFACRLFSIQVSWVW